MPTPVKATEFRKQLSDLSVKLMKSIQSDLDRASRSRIAVIVDELAPLEIKILTDPKLIQAAAEFARQELLRRNLRAEYEAHAAAGVFLAHGERYLYIVGSKEQKSTVNVLKLAKLVSLKILCRVAKVTLKAFQEEGISHAIRDQVVTTALTGPRSLKLLSKSQAE